MVDSLPFHPIPLALATLLSAHGLRKRSLSPSGAVAAFVVGYAMLSPPLKTFGVTLIVFYLVGSRATKYGKHLKSTLESNHDVAGYRNARQVLSNSLPALFAATLWTILFAQPSYSFLAQYSDAVREVMGLGTFRGMASIADGSWKGDGAWCVLDRTVDKGWSRALVYAALGQFSTCLGDTLASELGILARSPPRLVTTFRVVPPGTNGAISAWGTFCSGIGGAIVGAAAAAAVWYEDGACRGVGTVMELVGWGVVGGVGGSMVCGPLL